MPGKGYTPFWEVSRKKLHIKNEYVKEAIAEFLGTAILCIFAVGAGIQAGLTGPGVSSVQPVLGGIFGLMVAILVTGGISGAHINPAVTLGLAIAGETSWYKVPLYWICQIFGGYVGAGLAVSMYYWRVTLGKTVEFYENPSVSVGAFAAAVNVPIGTIFLDQIICASILMIGVLAIIDKRNMEVPKHLIAFLICLMVAGITMALGFQGGAMMNPARDMGPRLMALTVGYDGDEVLKNGEGEHIWLAMIFGPMIGTTIGTVLYILLIGAHLDEVDETKGKNEGAENDWRSTKFIPKASVKSPQGPNSPIPPPQPQNNNNQQFFNQQQPIQAYNQGYGSDTRNSNPQGGYNNGGYAPRDEMRSRQGY